MNKSREEKARLLIEHDLMEFVKSLAEHFGNNGKLPNVEVIVKKSPD